MYKEEVFQNVLFKVGFCKMPAMIKRKLKVKAGWMFYELWKGRGEGRYTPQTHELPPQHLKHVNICFSTPSHRDKMCGIEWCESSSLQRLPRTLDLFMSRKIRLNQLIYRHGLSVMLWIVAWLHKKTWYHTQVVSPKTTYNQVYDGPVSESYLKRKQIQLRMKIDCFKMHLPRWELLKGLLVLTLVAVAFLSNCH